jgi:hypothetical protein
MPRWWTTSFVVFVLAAAGILAGADEDHRKFVIPNVRDLTIKTRETIDLPQSTVQTTTLHFKGAWQRRELYLQFPSAFSPQRTVRHATITRCDERRILELNHESCLYGWSPRNFIARDVYWVRSRSRERPEPPAAGPEVKIIINTVDTGERRQLGSYSARHVITTTTTDPRNRKTSSPSSGGTPRRAAGPSPANMSTAA